MRWHVISGIFWRNVKQYFTGGDWIPGDCRFRDGVRVARIRTAVLR